MHSSKLGKIAIVLALCSPDVTASDAIAAPRQGAMGPTSRASIQIQVSVAPRLGIRWAARTSAGGPHPRPCFWSNDASRSYSVTLKHAVTHGSNEPVTGAPTATQPIVLPAGKSAADCLEHDGLESMFPALTSPSEGPYLLMIAPE